MNDIYEHKARKYKYKYLKLKNDLEGGLFNNKEKTVKFLENTVKILEKIIKYIKDVIGPVFRNNKVIGIYYDFENLPASLTTDGFNYKNNITIYNKIDKLPLSRIEYPKILKDYYDVKYRNPNDFESYHFESRLNKKEKIIYKKLSDEDETTIFDTFINPIAKNLDIYLIIMYIKKLFYYRFYSKFDKKTTIQLVDKLVSDAYENKIIFPDVLSIPNKKDLINEKKQLEDQKIKDTEQNKITRISVYVRIAEIDEILLTKLINEKKKLKDLKIINKENNKQTDPSVDIRIAEIDKILLENEKNDLEYIKRKNKEKNIQTEPSVDIRIAEIDKILLTNNKKYEKILSLTERIQEIIDSITISIASEKKK
jgi:hypothetical protein